LALALKRAELERARKKLQLAQEKRGVLLREQLQRKKKEEQQQQQQQRRRRRQAATGINTTGGGTSRSTTSSSGKMLGDISALRRTARISIRDISSSGPPEMVRIGRGFAPISAQPGRTTVEDIATPQRREKAEELRRRQKEILERRAGLLEKAERLKKRRKKQKLDGAVELAVSGVDSNDGTATCREDEVVTNRVICDEMELPDGAAAIMEASHAEFAATSNAESDLDRLKMRRSELRSTITAQTHSQHQLRHSIEVKNLRNMVNKQREVLVKQGQNLSEKSALLRKCLDDVAHERDELNTLDRRVEDMLGKKRKMEEMAGAITQKLLKSRRKRDKFLQSLSSSQSAGTRRDDATYAPLPLSANRSAEDVAVATSTRRARKQGKAAAMTAADFF